MKYNAQENTYTLEIGDTLKFNCNTAIVARITSGGIAHLKYADGESIIGRVKIDGYKHEYKGESSVYFMGFGSSSYAFINTTK